MGYKKRRGGKKAAPKNPEGAKAYEALKNTVEAIERHERYEGERTYEKKPRAMRKFERFAGKDD